MTGPLNPENKEEKIQLRVIQSFLVGYNKRRLTQDEVTDFVQFAEAEGLLEGESSDDDWIDAAHEFYQGKGSSHV